MTEKRLRDGRVAYYWSPTKRDQAAGFKLHSEPLGTDYGPAKDRAEELNRHLDAWRAGRLDDRDLDTQPGHGTLDWLVERYKRSKAWQRVSVRSRSHYAYIMRLALDLHRKSGARVGAALLTQLDAAAVDRLYERLQTGPRGRRLRVATMAMMRLAKAWDVVARLCPQDVPTLNPFRGMTLEHGKGTARAATRAEAFALHEALVRAGERHLAAVPLICFEWHQRPENVLAGSLTWSDWRPAARPNAVRILHAKTGAEVWQPLFDEDGTALFPELTTYLDSLPRLGVPVVLRKPIRRQRDSSGRLSRPPALPFTLREARARVRDAARAASLPDWLTLAACRHGGMTELGDAGATEAEVMASSGHRTPDAARLYVKRTEAQRLSAARKRRALRENGT
jgi:hypothetical protein